VPAVVGSRSPVAEDDWRLAESRGIAARLEAGGSLGELAGNLHDVTAGLDLVEALALDGALAAAVDEARGAADRSVEIAAGVSAAAVGSQLPHGHPLDALRGEGFMVRRLCAGLHAAAAFVVETGTRLLDLPDDLLSIDEQVLVPLAERHLAAGDWAAVREMEDGLGWSLIPAPLPWPTA
jgi:hypothetical protein